MEEKWYQIKNSPVGKVCGAMGWEILLSSNIQGKLPFPKIPEA